MKVRELGKFIRDERGAARLSLRKLSKLAGISNPYLSQIERGLRRPSAEILQAIAKALRISAETLYVKAGILEERSADTDLAAAIVRDTTITEKQKQVLLQVYHSFQHERDAAQRARRPEKVAAARERPRGASGSARRGRTSARRGAPAPAAGARGPSGGGVSRQRRPQRATARRSRERFA